MAALTEAPTNADAEAPTNAAAEAPMNAAAEADADSSVDASAAGADAPSAASASAIPSDDDTVAREPRPRMTRRRLLAAGGRGAGAAIAVVIAVVAIGGATLLDGPVWRTEPASTFVTPIPAAQQRVCPGPFLRLGDETGQGATSASSVGVAASVFQAVPDEVDGTPLSTTENTEGVAPLLLTLPPQDDEAADPRLAGSQSQLVGADDLVGFAAAECAEPRGDSWLVGGATDVGRTTLITISNPTTVVATVDLTIYSETGIVPAPGAEGIAIPPGAQRIFSLAGFAPGIVQPVVHVSSRGGQVVSSLQQSVVRTLAPGGVDLVAAGVGPVERAVIPGLVVSGAEAVIAAQSAVGYQDLGSVLRLLAPSDDGVGVSVVITPESDAAAPATGVDPATGAAPPPAAAAPGAAVAQPTSFDLELRAGEVSEVPISGLADGVYTVTVVSSAPVVSGVRSSVLTTEGASDLAWVPSAPRLAESTLVSVAAGPAPVVRLANDSGSPISATVVDGDAEVDVEVPSRGSVGVPVAPRSDLLIEADGSLRAAVTYFGASGVSAFAVTPPGPASTPLLVYR
jgi:hypothetical protein